MRPELIGAAERLGLPAGAVQGDHELEPEALAQRMLDHQPLELTDDGAGLPEGESRLDELLQREQPELFQPDRLAARPLQVGELVEGRPPPQRERALEERHGRAR